MIKIAIVSLLIVLVIPIIMGIIRIVPEYMRLVILTLGRVSEKPKGPGLVIVIPLIQRAIRVDLRERFLEIPQQTCITKDNASIGIDFLIYWKVIDPKASVINVFNFEGASQGIATTTLRAVVGDILLDDVLARREDINTVLRTKLDEITERWGVKVTSVEIREIVPPRDVLDAMTKQMAAERNRRAFVLEADGQREASIKVAEGAKAAEILKAEGQKQGVILRAEGFSLSLEKIYSIARAIDEKTMTLQYLETLKSMGESPATKFIFPLEFTNLLKPVLEYTSKVDQK